MKERAHACSPDAELGLDYCEMLYRAFTEMGRVWRAREKIEAVLSMEESDVRRHAAMRSCRDEFQWLLDGIQE